MKFMILVPRVVQSYINQFPETANNAYKYFNYDNRVVNERAETRFDIQAQYKGPEDLTDQDYDTIVAYAKSLVNPILAKYSPRVACEDALHMAIRSYDRGVYDGKVNASKYNVLLNVMQNDPAQDVMPLKVIPPMGAVMAKKKEEPKEKSQVIPQNILKRLNIKKVPLKSQVRKVQVGAPRIVRDKGKTVIEK